MGSRRFRAISFLALFWGAFSLVSAQTAQQFRGRVLDSSRMPVAGANILATPSGSTVGPSAVSDQSGEFSLQLPAGNYTLKITREGFVEIAQAISSPRADSAPQEFVLQVSPLSQALTVTDNVGYLETESTSAMKTLTPLRDVPQSITVVNREMMRDQLMSSIGDAVRYVPGIATHQGENNRDQLIIRGQSTSADFFVNGVRDDVQYYRDLYNLERVEAIKGPNAMIFGRGGGGGVVNRVVKEAVPMMPVREILVQGGSFWNRRIAGDFGQPFGEKVAVRMNAMYENSDSFRKGVNLERYGVSPTATFRVAKQTKVVLGYENFWDGRTADRGTTSFQGRPADVPISTFYGNPNDSHVRARVNLGAAALEHQAGRVNIRNRTQFAGYDRGYQNYVPGAVTTDKSQVTLTAYNNATQRLNIFNQTDVSAVVWTGKIRHMLLGGAEAGRQLTDNFRNTGFFNNSATSLLVPFLNPQTTVPVTFRQSVTDANNHLKTNLGATYIQDQVQLSRYVQAVGGVRFDHFDLQYFNNRSPERLRRIDNLVSPRAGLIIKPVDVVSIYGSYTVTYLPSSGDQFSSLTTITQQVKPEKFSNYEIGIKWDVRRYLSVTTAVYRLDRTNTRSTDPNDPTRIIQTGSTRSNGYELGLSGSVTRKWKIAGGYAYQDAYISSATTVARAGLQVAQVPHHSFSLWNSYQILPRLSGGLGIIRRSDMFATVDNTVMLPAYTRVDAALYYSLTEKMRIQANVENLLDKTYYVNADSNTNISPGYPRAVRVALVARF
jgi:catecholate siderophore receptor